MASTNVQCHLMPAEAIAFLCWVSEQDEVTAVHLKYWPEDKGRVLLTADNLAALLRDKKFPSAAEIHILRHRARQPVVAEMEVGRIVNGRLQQSLFGCQGVDPATAKVAERLANKLRRLTPYRAWITNRYGNTHKSNRDRVSQETAAAYASGSIELRLIGSDNHVSVKLTDQ